MPRATAAAAPRPAGAMVGAAKASEVVVDTDSAVPVASDEDLVADEVAELLAVVVLSSSSSLLATSLGGFCFAHLASILDLQSLWPC